MVDAHEIQAVAYVHPGRTVLGLQVEPILGAESVKTGTGYRIVAGGLRQRLRPSIVERVFQTVSWPLAQSYLSGVVIHAGLGFGERNRAALSNQRVIRCLVIGWNPCAAANVIGRLGQGKLIAVAIVRKVMARLAVISGALATENGVPPLPGDGMAALLTIEREKGGLEVKR